MMRGAISDKPSRALLEKLTLEPNMKVKRLSSHAKSRGRETSEIAEEEATSSVSSHSAQEADREL